jgi:hypothetical protein
MTATFKQKDMDRLPRAVVLGAGASRSVSYAHEREQPSPLDSDFFDLLNRLEPRTEDAPAVRFVRKQMEALPHDYRRSMERSFYTLQLRAYMAEKLKATRNSGPSDDEIVATFARCIQALLRTAHGKEFCKNHSALLSPLGRSDTVISFNYDLVVERAMRKIASSRRATFGDWVYGLAEKPVSYNLPAILKLHGSSNWRLPIEDKEFEVLTSDWGDFDDSPGYRGHSGTGTTFPIFLPFWDKRIERGPWRQLWTDCLARLEKTGTLVVWGYSLPPTDIKAQQLFTLGLSGRRFRLCVIDPSTATRDRWREMFPEAQYWEYAGVRSFLRHPPKWWNRK